MTIFRLCFALTLFCLSNLVYPEEISDSEIQTEIIIGIEAHKFSHKYLIKIPDNAANNMEKLQFEDISPANTDLIYQGTVVNWYWEWKQQHKSLDAQLIQFLSKEGKPGYARPEDTGEHYDEIIFSPDGKMIGLSVLAAGKSSGARKILVVDLASMALVDSKILKEGRYSAKLAWSPDSMSLAVLEIAKRTGISPFNLLMAFSGHPVPYNDFFLAVISISSKTMGETLTPFVRDVSYGNGGIDWRRHRPEK